MVASKIIKKNKVLKNLQISGKIQAQFYRKKEESFQVRDKTVNDQISNKIRHSTDIKTKRESQQGGCSQSE